jgi:hypothetical protein
MNCFQPLLECNKKFEYIFNSNTSDFKALLFKKIETSQKNPCYVVEFSDGSFEKLDVSTAAEAYKIASKKNTVKKISYTLV